MASGPNAPRRKGKFYAADTAFQDEAFKQADDRAKHGYPPTHRQLSIMTVERYEQIKDTLSPLGRKHIGAALEAGKQ